MFLMVTSSEVVFCAVGPTSSEYGKRYPVLTFYNDGSFGYMRQAMGYHRSQPGTLKKPALEYTVQELKDIVYDPTILYS